MISNIGLHKSFYVVFVSIDSHILGCVWYYCNATVHTGMYRSDGDHSKQSTSHVTVVKAAPN